MLLVGLGNPGEKYRFTRHNIGFMVLDEFARKNNFPEFTLNKKSNSFISKSIIAGEKVLLVKPQTFMNNSGPSVRILAKNYKLKTKNLVVVHDDIDIPFGRMKISVGSGSAGHKGIESIIKALSTQDFGRIRVGIQPADGKPERVEEFVLQQFSKEERAVLEQTIEHACSAIDSILSDGIEKAMSEFNK